MTEAAIVKPSFPAWRLPPTLGSQPWSVAPAPGAAMYQLALIRRRVKYAGRDKHF